MNGPQPLTTWRHLGQVWLPSHRRSCFISLATDSEWITAYSEVILPVGPARSVRFCRMDQLPLLSPFPGDGILRPFVQLVPQLPLKADRIPCPLPQQNLDLGFAEPKLPRQVADRRAFALHPPVTRSQSPGRKNEYGLSSFVRRNVLWGLPGPSPPQRQRQQPAAPPHHSGIDLLGSGGAGSRLRARFQYVHDAGSKIPGGALTKAAKNSSSEKCLLATKTSSKLPYVIR